MDEPELKTIIKLKSRKTRNFQLKCWQQKDDFEINMQSVVVVREGKEIAETVPWINCFGFFKAFILHIHAKHCAVAKSGVKE